MTSYIWLSGLIGNPVESKIQGVTVNLEAFDYNFRIFRRDMLLGLKFAENPRKYVPIFTLWNKWRPYQKKPAFQDV